MAESATIMAASTTATQRGRMVTLESLRKMLSSLPEPASVYAMDFKVFQVLPSNVLPNNTIIVSMDLAERLGWFDV